MSDFEIGLLYYGGIPYGYLDDFRASLPTERFRVSEDEVPATPGAAMEWIVPTAIAIYIAKPFVDIILKRASDDFADVVYPRLKGGIATLAKKVFIRDRLPLSRVTSKGPIAPSESAFFSIYSETTTNKRIKFVFVGTLPESQYDMCIQRAFELLELHHLSEDGTDELSLQIAALPHNRQDEIYLVYDGSSDTWEVRDPIQESIDKQRGRE
jgi:hypothetical protein